MKGRILSVFVAIVSLCAASYYVYSYYVESHPVVVKPKKKKICEGEQSSEEYNHEETSVQTFTVNGVSFNMIHVKCHSDFVLGSYIEGTGYRETEFEEDKSDEDLNDSEDEENDDESDSESTKSETEEDDEIEADVDDDSETDGDDDSETEEEAYGDSIGIINGYDVWADYDEGPTHNVSFSNPNYYLGETEVTVALWDAVMNDSVSMYESPNKPIANVSWYDCCLFIERLNKATGYKFRLPTEAEWEAAAGGGKYGSGYRFSGSNKCSDVAWYYENSKESIQEVAKLESNEIGLYDMSGNVWEWCLDYYKDNYYYLCKHIDPLCMFDTNKKVLRGGSFSEPKCRVRLEQKKGRRLDYHNEDCGFRLYLQLDSEDIYENKCETDTSLYKYVPISKYYKAEAEKHNQLE